MTTHDDLVLATLDPDDESPTMQSRLRGWSAAVNRGFHEPRMDEETDRRWRRHLREDGCRLRGAWPAAPAYGSGDEPVATFTSFDKTLDVDGTLLPLRMITDVTVSPTHRRRGLLRRLMTENLADAVDRGLPVAALTVSEGSIYGRFGFGLATLARTVEVDTGPRFALRGPVGPGQVVLLTPEEAWPAVRAVFDRFHATRHGSVDRPRFYQDVLDGSFNWEDRCAPDRKLHTAVALSVTGEPEGYVSYRHKGTQEGRSTVEVVDLIGLEPATYLRLWRFLADIDLVERVTWRKAPMEDPLDWALVNPHVARTTKIEDLLWVRLLDVPRGLAARRWGADGTVVLEVDDPLGHAAGRWRLTTRDGVGTAEPTEESGDVRLAADTLSTLFLRTVGVPTLAAADRITGSEDAVRRLAAMAAGGPAPYCLTGF